jgi:LmbE family N-acetylglucosaminyl deacetylase
MEKIITEIISQQRPCVFVSPHLDDAALSCGDLLSYLSTKTDVTVINVFTRAGKGGETLSAKKALSDSGFTTGAALYQARRAEDKAAFASVGIQVVNLGEIEALWRQKNTLSVLEKLIGKALPEVTHSYPTYRLHITRGKIASTDRETVERIGNKLQYLIPENAVVFSPLGIGAHADHLVVRKAVERYFQPLYWYDQPYNEREKKGSDSDISQHRLKYHRKNSRKHALIASYKTQIDLLFPQGVPTELPEYYTSKPPFPVS